MGEWSLITSHGLVLAAISRNSQKTARQIGDDAGITERRTHRIIVDLEQAGYIKRTKVGNHNVYTLNADMPLKVRFSDARVGDLLRLFGWRPQKRTKKSAQRDNI